LLLFEGYSYIENLVPKLAVNGIERERHAVRDMAGN
jgi:hypothetical protein